MDRKKRENPEDFIGWKSEDGKLEVIEMLPRIPYKNVTYKVTCIECSKDKELFPLGYFVSTKGNLKKEKKPCGCAFNPKWKDWQFLILARRAGEKKGFVVHGFVGEFKNNKTKLNLECLKDGHKWTTSISNIINEGNGCFKCKYELQKRQQRIPKTVALQKCIDICKEMDYEVIGFDGQYAGASKVWFEYICKIHGKQKVRYDSFVNQGTRCGGCAKDANGLYGYYPERKDEIDFLYILDFDNKFIKVGRSFDVDERIGTLKYQSKINRILKVRTFTATHQEIYDSEQELHSELRRRNFQHYVGWSTECFENRSLPFLNKMLDIINLKEVDSI